MRTSIPDIYAAGDIRHGALRRIVRAAADRAVAALSAIECLRRTRPRRRPTLEHPDRPQPRHQPGQARPGADPNRLVGVLVGLRGFLGQGPGARAATATPCSRRRESRSDPVTVRMVACRLMARPAPWQVEAKASLPASPTST